MPDPESAASARLGELDERLRWGVPELPAAEFAFPGPLRDRLVAAVLSGAKTATSSLLREYELDGDPLPRPGERYRVIDSDGRTVGVTEVSEVRVARLADVDLPHALAEGEGFPDVASWRAAHEQFWNSPAVRVELDPDYVIDDDTPVVLERFRLLG